MQGKQNDELQAEIDYWRKAQKELDLYWRLAYVLIGIGIVAFLIGLWQYEKSSLGFLAFLGLLGIAVGLTGYFETRRSYRGYQARIDINQAIIWDRNDRQ